VIDSILIPETTDSPLVEFDTQNSTLLIKGKSLLENTYDFYGPVLSSVNKFVNQTGKSLKVDVCFDYLNSSTSRYFMELLMILENSDGDHIINWLYEDGDDVIEEKGEQFKSLVELDFIMTILQLRRA